MLRLQPLYLILIGLLFSNHRSPKPRWVSVTPQDKKFIYLRGMGTGSTLETAKKNADSDIYRQIMEQNGISCKSITADFGREETLIIDGKETSILKQNFVKSLDCESNFSVGGLTQRDTYHRRKRGQYEMWVLKTIRKK